MSARLGRPPERCDDPIQRRKEAVRRRGRASARSADHPEHLAVVVDEVRIRLVRCGALCAVRKVKYKATRM